MSDDKDFENPHPASSDGCGKISDLRRQLDREKKRRWAAEQRNADLMMKLENLGGGKTGEPHSVSCPAAGNAMIFESIFDAIPDILGVQDSRHGLIWLNKAGHTFFNTKPDSISGKKCYQLLGNSSPCPGCAVLTTRKTGKPARIELYLEKFDLWMDVRTYPIFDADGNVFRLVEHLRDITEMKQMLESVHASEKKYRCLVDNASNAIFVVQDNQLKFPNPRARQMARELELDLDQIPVWDHIHPDDRKTVRTRHRRRIRGEPIPTDYAFKVRTKDGAEVWMELNTVKVEWEGRPATLNFLRDITHQKKLEAQFHEVQRLESLGTLAGGIAHDFNNLLMGIQGNISLLFMDIDEQSPYFDKLQNIEQCVDSGSNLTKQLLGFARGGKYIVRPTNLNEVVQKAANLFGRTNKELKIHGNYQKNIWTVEVDKGQVDQVLMNLFLNAAQAMTEGGDIYLKTDNVLLDESAAQSHGLAAGRYVKISLTDTGEGMDAHTVKRIFEPFFTTKEIGRGTGLGLASAFGIIKNHNGVINVKSSPGKGTTFTIFLPASDKPPDSRSEQPDRILRGHETILLVDDEDYILDVGRLMLEGLGYRIITANCGRAALELYSTSKNSVDLVILDMVMPDMGGAQVFDRIRAMDPDAKVLISSGYNIDERASELLDKGCNGFLQKPFNMKRFSQKIRQILDGEA